MMTLVMVWWLLSRVTMSITPRVMQPGSAMRITCSVPRHPENRWLTIAVPEYVSSTRQLDGEDEKITHTFYVDHMPCGVNVAVCDVVDNLGKHYTATTQFTVAGCEE